MAPGVDILAGWPEADTTKVTGPDGVMENTRYNVLSGTSMSCATVSGLPALIKARHPDWSPAAIKSALMTSARPLRKGTVLAFGAGDVNVIRAAGLIYDLTMNDYKIWLCGRNYTNKQYEAITGEPMSICPNTTAALNYPSITFSTAVGESIVTRTVTNVGPAVSKYQARIVQPGPGMVISVTPSTLSFTEANQKLSFTVSLSVLTEHTVIVEKADVEHFQGSLTWTDNGAEHQVFCPVSLWNYPA